MRGCAQETEGKPIVWILDQALPEARVVGHDASYSIEMGVLPLQTESICD